MRTSRAPSLEEKMRVEDAVRVETVEQITVGGSASGAKRRAASANLDTSTHLRNTGHATTIIDFGDGVLEARSVFIEGRKRLRSPRDKTMQKRELSAEQLAEKAAWSRARARRQLRFRCLCLKADHMITLTKRGKFETPDDAYAAFRRFNDIIRKFPSMEMQYVAVPEQHADGMWHIHVAVAGRYDVTRLRTFWYRALGGVGNERGEDSPGSINIRYFFQKRKAAYAVASYMSKYMAKSIEAIGPGKRAFWASPGLKPVSVEKVFEPVGDCLIIRLLERLRAYAPRARFGIFEWRYIGLSGVIVRSCT